MHVVASILEPLAHVTPADPDLELAERFRDGDRTARLVMVLPQFERRIQNQLRRAILNQRAAGRAGGRAGGRGRGGDDDDAGDDGDLDFSGGPRDPFANRPGTRHAPDPAPTRAPAPPPTRGGNKPCDPFSTVHGCSSK